LMTITNLPCKLSWGIMTDARDKCKKFFVRTAEVDDGSESVIEDLLLDILRHVGDAKPCNVALTPTSPTDIIPTL